MNDHGDERLRRLLQDAMPPLGTRDLPERDLWPRMLYTLDRRPGRQCWLDVLLAALAGAWFSLFPQAILAALYQL
jgi:hypothetical protein